MTISIGLVITGMAGLFFLIYNSTVSATVITNNYILHLGLLPVPKSTTPFSKINAINSSINVDGSGTISINEGLGISLGCYPHVKVVEELVWQLYFNNIGNKENVLDV